MPTTEAGFAPVTYRISGDPYRYVECLPVANVDAAVRPPSPPRALGGNTFPPLVTAVEALEAAGLDVPAEVTEPLARALALRKESYHDEPRPRMSLAEQLGSGDIGAADAERLVAKDTAKPAADPAERRRVLLEGAESAYRSGVAALAAIGDDLITGPLAETVDDLLANPLQEDGPGRWARTWEAVTALRENGFASYVRGAPKVALMFERSHTAHAWGIAEAMKRDRRSVRVTNDYDRGKYVFHVRRAEGGPDPCSLDVAARFKDEWGARVLTAEETLHILQQIVAAEDALGEVE